MHPGIGAGADNIATSICIERHVFTLQWRIRSLYGYSR